MIFLKLISKDTKRLETLCEMSIRNDRSVKGKVSPKEGIVCDQSLSVKVLIGIAIKSHSVNKWCKQWSLIDDIT